VAPTAETTALQYSNEPTTSVTKSLKFYNANVWS